MVDKVGSDDDSNFDSVTSSQKSFLKNCPFADPFPRPTKSSDEMVETDAESTEILGNQISPTVVVKTPIISFSSPTSLDSINDEDVFRTPPENVSLSSSAAAAADSEPRVRVSKLKSPSPVSASSPSLPVENVKVLSDSVTEVMASLSSPASVRVPGKHSPFPTAIGKTRVSKLKSPSSRTNFTPVSASSPTTVAANNVRVPGNKPISDSVGITGVPKASSPALNLAGSSGKISESEDLPFKEIMEALLRNSGENLSGRDEKVSCVDILKNCGFKFP